MDLAKGSEAIDQSGKVTVEKTSEDYAEPGLDFYAKRAENKSLVKGSDAIDQTGKSTFEKTTSDYVAHGSDAHAKRAENKSLVKGSDAIDHSGESTFEKTTSDYVAHGSDAFAKRAENKSLVKGSDAIDQTGKGTFEKTSDEVGAAEQLRQATILLARRHSQINVDARKGTVEEQLFRSVDQILNHMRTGIKARARSDNDMRRNMEQIFRRFDTNKDGCITFDSFQKTVNQFFGINLSMAQAQKVFKVLDEDGNGTVERQEFVKAFLDFGSAKDKPEDMFSARVHAHHDSGGARAARDKAIAGEARKERKNSMIQFQGLSAAEILKQIREKAQGRASSDLLLSRKLKTLFPDFNEKGGMTQELFRNQIGKTFGIMISAAQTKELFRMIDTDDNGTLDRDELIEGLFGKEAMIKEYQQQDSHDVAMTKLSDNLATERRKSVVQVVQAQNQPKAHLTTTQILAEIRSNIKRRARTETDITRFMQQLFRRFDKGNTGYITPEAFRTIVEDFFGINLSTEQQVDLFNTVDSDSSGTIEREELVIAFLGREVFANPGVGAGPKKKSKHLERDSPRGKKVDTWKEGDQEKAEALVLQRRKEKGEKQAVAAAAAAEHFANNRSEAGEESEEVQTKFGQGKLQTSNSRPDGVAVVDLKKEEGGLGATAYLQEGAEGPDAAAFAALAAAQASGAVAPRTSIAAAANAPLTSSTAFSPGQSAKNPAAMPNLVAGDDATNDSTAVLSNTRMPMPPLSTKRQKGRPAPARKNKLYVAPEEKDHRIMQPLPPLTLLMGAESPAAYIGVRKGARSGKKSTGRKLRSLSKKQPAQNFTPNKIFMSPADQRLPDRLLELARGKKSSKKVQMKLKLTALTTLTPERNAEEGVTLSPRAIRTHIQHLKTTERMRLNPRPPPSVGGSVASYGARAGVEAASDWHTAGNSRPRMRQLTRISDEIALAPPSFYKHHSPRSSKKAQAEARVLPRLPKLAP
jgi:Ca2+-binding EF-hand superfamily protein